MRTRPQRGIRRLPRVGHGAAVAAAAASKPLGYTKRTLDFHVKVPNENVGGTGTQMCTIVGDLFRPAKATKRHRVPVILTTNGFGGSKNDQDALAAVAAKHGYGVLSYSGLGFGGSTCKISLDDPSYDGRAGRQLISFLGGKPGIATTLAGKKVKPVTWIVHDRRDHLGRKRRYDPRVGMVGGSYGGQIQFAVADKDPRLDAIVPIITWSDLSYSLAPNDTGFVHGVTYNTAAPGTDKVDWVSLFFADGMVDGLQGATLQPARDVGCVNFLTKACEAYVDLASNAIDPPSLFTFSRHASVESYVHNVRIPTLLMQGQGDTLFNLQEAVANYHALRKQGTQVKMIWQSWGHSVSTPQPGEWTEGPGVLKTYEGKRVFAWFAHYLKGKKNVKTGPALRLLPRLRAVQGQGSGHGAVRRVVALPSRAGQDALRLSRRDAGLEGVGDQERQPVLRQRGRRRAPELLGDLGGPGLVAKPGDDPARHSGQLRRLGDARTEAQRRRCRHPPRDLPHQGTGRQLSDGCDRAAVLRQDLRRRAGWKHQPGTSADRPGTRAQRQ